MLGIRRDNIIEVAATAAPDITGGALSDEGDITALAAAALAPQIQQPAELVSDKLTDPSDTVATMHSEITPASESSAPEMKVQLFDGAHDFDEPRIRRPIRERLFGRLAGRGTGIVQEPTAQLPVLHAGPRPSFVRSEHEMPTQDMTLRQLVASTPEPHVMGDLPAPLSNGNVIAPRHNLELTRIEFEGRMNKLGKDYKDAFKTTIFNPNELEVGVVAGLQNLIRQRAFSHALSNTFPGKLSHVQLAEGHAATWEAPAKVLLETMLDGGVKDMSPEFRDQLETKVVGILNAAGRGRKGSSLTTSALSEKQAQKIIEEAVLESAHMSVAQSYAMLFKNISSPAAAGRRVVHKALGPRDPSTGRVSERPLAPMEADFEALVRVLDLGPGEAHKQVSPQGNTFEYGTLRLPAVQTEGDALDKIIKLSHGHIRSINSPRSGAGFVALIDQPNTQGYGSTNDWLLVVGSYPERPTSQQAGTSDNRLNLHIQNGRIETPFGDTSIHLPVSVWELTKDGFVEVLAMLDRTDQPFVDPRVKMLGQPLPPPSLLPAVREVPPPPVIRGADQTHQAWAAPSTPPGVAVSSSWRSNPSYEIQQ